MVFSYQKWVCGCEGEWSCGEHNGWQGRKGNHEDLVCKKSWIWLLEHGVSRAKILGQPKRGLLDLDNQNIRMKKQEADSVIAIKSSNFFSVSGPATTFWPGIPLLKRADHQGKNCNTTSRHCDQFCTLSKGSVAISWVDYTLKKGKYPSILGNFDLTLISQYPKPHPRSPLEEGHGRGTKLPVRQNYSASWC